MLLFATQCKNKSVPQLQVVELEAGQEPTIPIQGARELHQLVRVEDVANKGRNFADLAVMLTVLAVGETKSTIHIDTQYQTQTGDSHIWMV